MLLPGNKWLLFSLWKKRLTNENWWYFFVGASWFLWPLKVVHRCECERQCVFCPSVSALWGTGVYHRSLRYETSDAIFLCSVSIAIISFFFFFFFSSFYIFDLLIFIYLFQFLTEPCCLQVHNRNRGFLTPEFWRLPQELLFVITF